MEDDVTKSLHSSLRKLSESKDMRGLVEMCYSLRRDKIGALKMRSKHPKDDFGKTAHLIGRIGSTRSKVDALVQCTLQLPALRHITGIRTVRAPEVREVPLKLFNSSPYEIIRNVVMGSATQNPSETQQALVNFVPLDLNTAPAFRDVLKAGKSIVTRVHAELQLADEFSRNNRHFLSSDTYIGCSKPACYFCYNWLSNHQRGYVLPATHQKIILGCRAPDLGLNQNGADIMEKMYKKTCKKLDQDIMGFLLRVSEKDLTYKGRYMSTEGSSYVPSSA